MKKILFVFALVLSGQLLDAQNEIVPKKKSQKYSRQLKGQMLAAWSEQR